MKKLFIIFITFFLTSKAYSIEFNKCFIETIDGKNSQEKFDKKNTQKHYFSISSKKISLVKVWTDEAYKRKIESIEKRLRSKIKQYDTRIFNIYYADNSLIKAKRYEPILRSDVELIIDLNSKKISKIIVPGTDYESISVYKCKFKSSSYLDYWWAVILIIAISLFIFTQSGKRLKRIRRK